MIPKKIHLCWFGGGSFPVEIKMCIESWTKILPDYEIRLWNARDALSIGCQYIDEALDAGKWAFAADAVRFYALWKEGGIYMDADVMLTKRFDRYIPERGFACAHGNIDGRLQLQPAFLIGDKGNAFCREMSACYDTRTFNKYDGSYDETGSASVMRDIATGMGWKEDDRLQILDNETVIYPGHLVTPRHHDADIHPDAFACHLTYGSCRKRSLGQRIRQKSRHLLATIRYSISHLGQPTALPPVK